MRKSNYQDFQGNDQYEGFCVDMLRELADILKFSFKIKLVDDALYGAPEPNGSWTGMVGELINRVSGGGRYQYANASTVRCSDELLDFQHRKSGIMS